MISPEFRNSEDPKLQDAVKKYITEHYGDGMYVDLQNDIMNVNNVRNRLHAAPAYKTDLT